MQPPLDGTVLVTGASAGIGRELARELALRAGALILVARRADRLEALRDELRSQRPDLRVDLFSCDLADAAAVESLLRAVDETGPVDVLVNNAGLGHYRLYEQAEWPMVHRMIEVNVVALARLTYHFLPGMVSRGRGGILNVGSGAGFAIMPGSAVYSATKYFVHGFSEALRAELAGTSVVVTHLAPGPVPTEFNEAAGVRPEESRVPPWLTISPRQCAREAVRGFERGKPLVFPGRQFRALMRLLGVAPRALQRLGAAGMGRRLREEGGR